jgi:hypothetical protein
MRRPGEIICLTRNVEVLVELSQELGDRWSGHKGLLGFAQLRVYL